MKRIGKGEYMVEHYPYIDTTTYIYKVGNIWIYNVNHGMTQGSFSSLKKLREVLGI